MLTPRLLRTLTVDPSAHPRGQPHLSAASGLVHINDRCYVVSDDEHHLGKFKTTGNDLVKLRRMFDGDLPTDPVQRKAAKPDLETLCLLPATPRHPHGALLALGSGSKDARHTGLLMAFNALGKLGKGDELVTQRLDLGPLYASLHTEFADLNIEGCFVDGDVLHLVQRGNRGNPRSACIHLHLPQVQAWILDEENTPPPPSHIVEIDLGEVDGIPLTPTDACALPGGSWLMSAVAENTNNSVQDGPSLGSALAIVDPRGNVLQLRMIDGAPKVEGISADVLNGKLNVLMVTDADDPAVASELLSVVLGL